jgi:Bacterial Ig-like domain (group 3)/FG-GAP-like repeat
MTRHFARKFQILSVVVLFVATISVLMVFAAPAIAQNPAPFLDQPPVPEATAPGGPAFTLKVNGAGFVATSVVNWNGSPRATTFVRSSQLTATILASDIATASTAAVTVVNPSPGGGVSNTQFFSIAVAKASASFLPAVTYDTGGVNAYHIAAADLNGDGKLDLVVTNCSGPNSGCGLEGVVGILLGNGDGTFQPVVTYHSGGNEATSVAVADLNGDGILDLVVTNSNVSNTVGVLLGNGDGTFLPAVTYSSGGQPGSVAVADVNRDGKPDILLALSSGCNACTNGGGVGVLLGNGDGTFQPVVTYSSGGYYAGSIAVEDLGNNGKLDVVVTNLCGGDEDCSGNGSVGVLLGKGDGTFSPAVALASGGQAPGSVAVADVNGDGKPDLLVANSNCLYIASCGLGAVGVLLGKGDGTFQPPVLYGSGGYGADSLAVADVNGDGKADLVVANLCSSSGSNCPFFETGIVGVLLGNGDGTFKSVLAYGSGGIGAASAAAADVNGDGRPDLLVANLGSLVGVLLNNSGPHTPTTTALTSSENPARVKQRVTYTATVASQFGGTATGTVKFQDSGATVATVALSNNQAAYSTSYPTVGIHSITATYSGDLNNAGSTSPMLTEDIDGATKTVVTTSGSPSFAGQSVTFTATVTSVYGAIPNGETVTFYTGGTAIGTGTTAGGLATFTTSSLTAATHAIRAAYSGDATFEPSGGTVTQVVEKYATTTALVSSLDPSNYGQAVTFTATVTPTGPHSLTAKVVFKDGTLAIGSVALSEGVATLTKPKLAVGANSITATYLGDAFNVESVSPAITQNVSQASVSMVLASTPNPSTFGKSVKFTATLASNGGVPSGQSVTFSYNDATLGTAIVNSIGVATFSTTTLPLGSDVVTATYAGSVDYSSASANVTQVVN